MTVNNYKEYIIDSIYLFVDKIKELETEIRDSNQNDKEYIKGQIMAYYDVLTTLSSQSEMFDIPLSDLGLENLSLEKYLTLD